jgi:GNAT superfamily N-acetyltransferase
MEIVPLIPQHLPAAAALFAENFHSQRIAVPALPETMEDPAVCIDLLSRLTGSETGAPRALAALKDDRLVGYLGWFIFDRFRGADDRAAYCPVWAHATVPANRRKIYTRLYKAAAQHWTAAGCPRHTLTLLAADDVARETWFWNGFGLLVVDAVRWLTPLNIQPPTDIRIRKASVDDAPVLAELESIHWKHYSQPPVLMAPNEPDDAQALRALLAQPQNSVWLAEDAGRPVAFLRFEASSEGAAEIVRSETTTAITGAFVRPEHRGRRIMPALLSAGLDEARAHGLTRCAVDFESFNPEAAAFWPRYFDPVCFSLSRRVEYIE